VGLTQEISKKEVDIIHISKLLLKPEYLGQYGKITKVIINKPVILGQNKNNYSVYVTFQTEMQAIVCRLALRDFNLRNMNLKASLGTTK
jgi:hypothetical protein